MMFSTKAEYGVRVMAHLAGTATARPISLGAIAEAEGLPLAYLEHLVQRLRAGRARGVPPRRARRLHAGAPARGRSRWPRWCGARGRDRPDRVHHRRRRRRARLRPRGRAGHEPCPTKLLWTRVQGSIVRTLTDMTLADLVRPMPRRKSPHEPRDPEPARPHRGARDPPRRRPQRREGRDPRADGPQRLRQVHARQHAHGQPRPTRSPRARSSSTARTSPRPTPTSAPAPACSWPSSTRPRSPACRWPTSCAWR